MGEDFQLRKSVEIPHNVDDVEITSEIIWVAGFPWKIKTSIALTYLDLYYSAYYCDIKVAIICGDFYECIPEGLPEDWRCLAQIAVKMVPPEGKKLRIPTKEIVTEFSKDFKDKEITFLSGMYFTYDSLLRSFIVKKDGDQQLNFSIDIHVKDYRGFSKLLTTDKSVEIYVKLLEETNRELKEELKNVKKGVKESNKKFQESEKVSEQLKNEMLKMQESYDSIIAEKNLLEKEMEKYKAELAKLQENAEKTSTDSFEHLDISE